MVAQVIRPQSHAQKQLARTNRNFHDYVDKALLDNGLAKPVADMVSRNIDGKFARFQCRIDASELEDMLLNPESTLYQLNSYFETGVQNSLSQNLVEKFGREKVRAFAEWLDNEVNDGKKLLDLAEAQLEGIRKVVNHISVFFNAKPASCPVSVQFEFSSKSNSRPPESSSMTL